MSETPMQSDIRSPAVVERGEVRKMKRCPYCAEDIQDAAIKCRYCGSMLEGGFRGQWYRKREGRMVAGVCNGLAEQFGLSVVAVRLSLVLLALLGFGWGVLLYIVMWVIMPYGPKDEEATTVR